MIIDKYPYTFAESLQRGIQRCNTLRFLNEYYLRWKDEIEIHPDKKQIIGWFSARKKELKDAMRGL